MGAEPEAIGRNVETERSATQTEGTWGHGFCSDLIPKGKQDGGNLKPKGKQEGGNLKPKG